MIVKLDEAHSVNMRKLTSTGISRSHTSEMVETSFFFGWFKSEKEVKTDVWMLTVKFVCDVTGDHKVTTWTCGDRLPLEKAVQNIMQQIKNSDSFLVDRAFEDAFLKDTK